LSSSPSSTHQKKKVESQLIFWGYDLLQFIVWKGEGEKPVKQPENHYLSQVVNIKIKSNKLCS
jgi:hypothetical protein